METRSVRRGESMYLVLPVPFRRVDDKLYVEGQAFNGLDRWADNFEKLTVSAPVISEQSAAGLAGFVWKPVDELEHTARIVCDPLPEAYSPQSFFKILGTVRARMAQHIRDHKHLQFAIGGLIGDWAAVAALEAIKQNRRYAIHTDRVEHEVMRKVTANAKGLRKLKAMVEMPLMKRYHRHLIKHCSLGLWHGDDCFRAYAPWSKENHLIHDVHTKDSDRITEEQMKAKLVDVRGSEVLQVVYAGRLDPMKAPVEWVKAIATARNAGVSLKATWYGEGPLRDATIAEVKKLHLEDVVSFAGFVADRAQLMAGIRGAHVFCFTHITPESPRNLLESLISGTPIVGYDNAYAENLLDGYGGGQLVPIHDTTALGDALVELSRDREKLASMVLLAADNGTRFTDAAVFEERSALIQKYA